MKYQVRLRYGCIDCLDFINAVSMLEARDKADVMHSQSLKGIKLVGWNTDSLIQCSRTLTLDGIRFRGQLTVSKLIA